MTPLTRLAAGSTVALVLATGAALAQTPPASAGPVDPALIEDLVVANRVLAQEGLFDAYGHASVRHPGNPNRYLLSRSLAPALVICGPRQEPR